MARLSKTSAKPSVPDYELLRRIGGGAYGEVWLARNVATGALRAAKIVWRHSFEDERPFQREFEGLQLFERISRQHPSQLALFHIGRNDIEGYFYYVMELADAIGGPKCQTENPTIHECANNESNWLAEPEPVSALAAQASDSAYKPHTLRYDIERGRLAAKRVLEIGLALAEALANLHGHGLVHRDVKPSNVIFVNGRPKLADIGLVTESGDGRSIVGTEGYMAPEGPGAAQADLFALGKLLYEAATGMDRRQFPRLPPELRSWPEAKLVLELNEVIVKACAVRLAERYANAREMLSDLELLTVGRSVKHLRLVEHRLSLLTRAAAVVSVCAVAALGIFYETYRQRQIALRSLVRLHVSEGTQQLNQGDLFGSLLSFTEALRLEAGDSKREEVHRIRIASVLRQCPQLVGMFAHTNAPINDAAFSPDSRRMVTAGDDHIAQAWGLATGERLFSMMHTGPVYSVGFSPDGTRIATTSSDGLVHLWNGQTGEPLRHQPIRHRGWYNGPSPQFSPDGLKILTLPDLHTVSLWQGVTGEPIGRPLRHDQEVSNFAFSPDGRRVVTLSSDRAARLWDASTGEALYSVSHSGLVSCGAFSPDSQFLATGGDDDCARFWESGSGGEILPLLIHHDDVDSVAYSPDGTRLATACRDRTVELWDVTTNQPLLRPLLHERRVLRVDFSPDGSWLVSSSEGNRIRFWDADTGELRAPPLVHDTPRRPVLFSPDGHLMLTLRHDLTLEREEVAVVWNLASKQPPVLPIRPVPSFRKTAASPNGRLKAVLTGDTVRTIAVDSGRAVGPPLKQSVPFRQVYFSRDNTVLLAESAGGRGQLWDLSRGEPLTPMLPIAYDRNAQVPSKADLLKEARPIKDLVFMAELLSGNEVDETGGFRPLDSSSLMHAWNTLRTKYPSSFMDATNEVLDWHDQEARRCEQAWNWWSACFHLKYLVAARKGNQELAGRLAYAELALENANRKASSYPARRSLAIPPRNPQASQKLIDLSGFYNVSRRGEHNSMAGLPSGLQTFAGTEFDVRGVVQLSDRKNPGPGHRFVNQVSGIPVNQICRRLHFLHATASDTEEGIVVSSYVVHYSDQQSQRIDNVYGRDVRSWWTNPGESLSTDPEHAELVWMGTNPQAESSDAKSLRMFKRTWENPWADRRITSVDFESARRGVGPFLVAITAE
ncbi:MAG TPA: protein kinase [Candidatus Limnocylindrales bacterium]|jgi:WD40 repeat protein|nr:protein kinase [Candidatus Limnocylindrales bacterium]